MKDVANKSNWIDPQTHVVRFKPSVVNEALLDTGADSGSLDFYRLSL